MFCPECKDIVRLVMDEYRLCSCEKCLGQYIDIISVKIEGPAIILGINNFEFKQALDNPGLDIASIFRIKEPYDKIIRSDVDDN